MYLPCALLFLDNPSLGLPEPEFPDVTLLGVLEEPCPALCEPELPSELRSEGASDE